MIVLLWFLLRLLPSLFNSTTGRLEAENAALRHQLIARRRTTLPDPRPERDLRRSRHTPATRYGYPRQTNCPRLAVAEWVRLISTIRRDCVDHMIVFGEVHLRRILGEFAAYYNESRTHRALSKDAPVHRAIERLGDITSRPILGGLHHKYCRILVFGTYRVQ